MDLKGKVCLVTGGSSGIGAATALTLAERGANVAVAARTPVPLPDDLLTAVHAQGAKAAFFAADVAESESCRRCVDEVVSAFGGLDVLVHSAGGPAPGGFYAVTEETWMNAFAVHVHSAFWLARAVAPQMAKRGGGAIILLGSAAGMRGCLGAFAYGVVKGALPHLARVLGRELADENIRVNCVSPGIIRTPFHDSMSPEQAKHNLDNRIPLHREGTPQDVAALITTLVQNDFITGENMVIDGGMTMRIV